MADKPKCLVFEHSFVRRLKNKQHRDPLKFKSNLGLEQCNVTLKGFEGLNFGLTNLEEKEKFYSIVDSVFCCSRYDIVICQLGGNDIAYDLSPGGLRQVYIDFIGYIQDKYNVKLVYICSVFTRPKPRYIAPADYELFRDQINHLLEQDAAQHECFIFWQHKRIFNSPFLLFENDGTHLNTPGTIKFHKSLRQAAIFAVEEYKRML